VRGLARDGTARASREPAAPGLKAVATKAEQIPHRRNRFDPDWEPSIPGRRRVLHNWDLETKKMLLAKAYQATPARGAVVVYDLLIDDDRRTSRAGLLSSLNMLLWTTGGFGYTASDCTGWLHSAGFARTSVRELPGGNSMIVGEK